MRPTAYIALSVFVSAACLSTGLSAAEPEWSGWRGPQQDGHSSEANLPVKWGPESVAWEVPLKGSGQSSPVIAGNRIFLTSAAEDGRERILMCLNREDGKLLWSETVWTGDPEPTHNMNGWASATCVTDGERVYAFFGKGGGLFCYSMDGKQLWNKPLGDFDGPWGTAACPVLFGDLVIQNCDADTNAFIAAFDKTTGNEVWRTKREDARGWSTPIIIKAAGRDELVVNGHSGVRAYNPAAGEELWYCRGFAGRGTPTVTPVGDLLHVVCGLKGDTYAVRPGGSGNVTKTHMVWHQPRRTARDLPAPIVIGQQSLVMDMRRATLTAHDIATGKEVWQERVADAAVTGQFCATPVSWSGIAFFVAESGQTIAVKPGEKMEVVSVNDVDPAKAEIFRSSPTPDKGQILLRSNIRLYCIGK